jgi:hypothetical protein
MAPYELGYSPRVDIEGHHRGPNAREGGCDRETDIA